MKKLLIVVAALAMAASFMPKVEAADSANLTLEVTFAKNQAELKPPHMVTFPPSEDGVYYAEEEEVLEFVVVAYAYDENVDTLELWAEGLPEGAGFSLSECEAPPTIDHFEEGENLTENAELVQVKSIQGIFTWKPQLGQGQIGYGYAVHGVVFRAASANENDSAEATLKVGIKVQPKPKLSISLNNDGWELSDVAVGKTYYNYETDNNGKIACRHRIINDSNMVVAVEIAYVPRMVDAAVVRPGTTPGKNRFVTKVGTEGTVIPPPANYAYLEEYEDLAVVPPSPRPRPHPYVRVGRISVGGTRPLPLPLTFVAPTEISEDVDGMSVMYEIRATAEPPEMVEENAE